MGKLGGRHMKGTCWCWQDQVGTLRSGQYYKQLMIVINDPRVIRTTPQIVASPMIAVLMTLVVSFTLLENIYSTNVTHNSCHMTIVIYFYNTGHKLEGIAQIFCQWITH